MAPALAPGALGSNRRMPGVVWETVGAWPGSESSAGCREEELVSRESVPVSREEEPDTTVLLVAVTGTGGSQEKSLGQHS